MKFKLIGSPQFSVAPRATFWLLVLGMSEITTKWLYSQGGTLGIYLALNYVLSHCVHNVIAHQFHSSLSMQLVSHRIAT